MECLDVHQTITTLYPPGTPRRDTALRIVTSVEFTEFEHINRRDLDEFVEVNQPIKNEFHEAESGGYRCLCRTREGTTCGRLFMHTNRIQNHIRQHFGIRHVRRQLLDMYDPETLKYQSLIKILTSLTFQHYDDIGNEELQPFVETLLHPRTEFQKEGSRGGPKGFRCLWETQRGVFCGKEIKRRDHMQNHVRVHFGIKPFQCLYKHAVLGVWSVS